MKLKIHRGDSQTGDNIVEIAAETAKIILDCGRSLPPLDDPKAADNKQIKGLTCGKSAYDAVFITHYRTEHCGLINRINHDIPVYMSTETKVALNVIADFINAPPPRVNHIFENGREITVGGIKILPLCAKSGAEGALMFLVEADGKKLLYTGDINHIDESILSKIGKIDVLLCEGTNIGVKEGKTENDVETEAAQIMRVKNAQVFVLCSTTNIERVRVMEKACKESGRTMAIDPFMNTILKELGYDLDKPVGYMSYFIDENKNPRQYKYFKRDMNNFNCDLKISKMSNLTFMVRQTSGDFLKRLNKLTPLAGSRLIYSMWRGYEKKAGMKKFLNLCAALKIKIEYLHASGQVYREQLETVIARLNPKTLIPIHTENPEIFREMHQNVVLPGKNKFLDC